MTEPFDRDAARKKLEALRAPTPAPPGRIIEPDANPFHRSIEIPRAALDPDVPLFSTTVHEVKPGDFSNILPPPPEPQVFTHSGVTAQELNDEIKNATTDGIAESFFQELAKHMGWTLEHARQSQAARAFLPIVQTIVECDRKLAEYNRKLLTAQAEWLGIGTPWPEGLWDRLKAPDPKPEDRRMHLADVQHLATIEQGDCEAGDCPARSDYVGMGTDGHYHAVCREHLHASGSISKRE